MSVGVTRAVFCSFQWVMRMLLVEQFVRTADTNFRDFELRGIESSQFDQVQLGNDRIFLSPELVRMFSYPMWVSHAGDFRVIFPVPGASCIAGDTQDFWPSAQVVVERVVVRPLQYCLPCSSQYV